QRICRDILICGRRAVRSAAYGSRTHARLGVVNTDGAVQLEKHDKVSAVAPRRSKCRGDCSLHLECRSEFVPLVGLARYCKRGAGDGARAYEGSVRSPVINLAHITVDQRIVPSANIHAKSDPGWSALTMDVNSIENN